MKMGCCLGRYSSGAEDSEELENQICIGKNRPLHQDRLKWTSECPMTEGQLRSKRDEFWETAPAFEGRKEIWDALRAAATHAEQHDFALAQAIVDGANITLPTGTLTETYDELGNRYQIPIYCLFCPTNMAEERSESSYGSMRETYSTDSLAVGCHGNSAATPAPPPTDAFPVLFRLSDSPTTSADLELLVRPKETIFHLKQRLFLANQRKRALLNPLINETPPVVVSSIVAHGANPKTNKIADKPTVPQPADPHSSKKVIENGHVNKRAISGLMSSNSTKKNICGPMSIDGAVGNHSSVIKNHQSDELNANDVVAHDNGAGPDIRPATVVPAPRAQKWYFGGRLLTDKMRVDQTALEPYFVVQVVVVNAEDQLSTARTAPGALIDRLVGEANPRAQSSGSNSSIHSPLIGLGCTEHAKTAKVSKRKKSSVNCHSGCGCSPSPNCPLCKSSQCAQCKLCHKLTDRTDDVSEKSQCRHNAGDSDSGEVANGLLKGGRRHKHRHHHHHCHKSKQRSHERHGRKDVSGSAINQGTTCREDSSHKPTSGNRCCGAVSIPGMICTDADVDSDCITVVAPNETSASGADATSPLYAKTISNVGGSLASHVKPNSPRSDCGDVKVQDGDFSGVDRENNAMWDESVVSAHFDGLWPASKLNGIKDLILDPTVPLETFISSEICRENSVAELNHKFGDDDTSLNGGVIENSFSDDRKLSSLIVRNVSDSPVSSVSASKILATITNSSPAVTLKTAGDSCSDMYEPLLLCQNIDDKRDEKTFESESVPPFSTTGLNSRKVSISLAPVE